MSASSHHDESHCAAVHYACPDPHTALPSHQSLSSESAGSELEAEELFFFSFLKVPFRCSGSSRNWSTVVRLCCCCLSGDAFSVPKQLPMTAAAGAELCVNSLGYLCCCCATRRRWVSDGRRRSTTPRLSRPLPCVVRPAVTSVLPRRRRRWPGTTWPWPYLY